MFTAMIVDDEEWALTGAMHVFPFSDAGFVPILATTDSAEAADCLLRKKPDLVIADIRMPEVSGLDLLHLARERGVESIFVLLSGYADFLYAQQAISYGAFEYCLKPIRKEQAQELLTKAAGALMRKQGGEGAAFTESEGSRFGRLLAYMDAHFREPLQQKILCGLFSINPSYGSRLFAKRTGMSFSGYLTKLRMKEAKRLLLGGSHSVVEVAELCGYSDYYYFIKVYTRYFGISPSKTKKAALI